MSKRRVLIEVEVEVDADHILSKEDEDTDENVKDAVLTILGRGTPYDDFRQYFDELEGFKVLGDYRVRVLWKISPDKVTR